MDGETRADAVDGDAPSDPVTRTWAMSTAGRVALWSGTIALPVAVAVGIVGYYAAKAWGAAPPGRPLILPLVLVVSLALAWSSTRVATRVEIRRGGTILVERPAGTLVVPAGGVTVLRRLPSGEGGGGGYAVATSVGRFYLRGRPARFAQLVPAIREHSPGARSGYFR